MFRRFCVQKVLYSEGSMFRNICSEGPMFRKYGQLFVSSPTQWVSEFKFSVRIIRGISKTPMIPSTHDLIFKKNTFIQIIIAFV